MDTVLLTILINGGGFLFGGSVLHWLYYSRRSASVRQWKHQPERTQNVRQLAEKLPLVLLNMAIINGFIGFGIAMMNEGYTRASWEFQGFTSIWTTVALFFWYHGLLYYMHRFMHRPACFRAIHHLHHRYKTPMFLDALYEHPIEAVWGGIVLSSSLFVLPVWGPGYLFFVAVVGIHEVLDHAGIDLNLPLLSRSRHHDEHHRWSNCYYGQLLSLLDTWHETIRRTRN